MGPRAIALGRPAFRLIRWSWKVRYYVPSIFIPRTFDLSEPAYGNACQCSHKVNRARISCCLISLAGYHTHLDPIKSSPSFFRINATLSDCHPRVSYIQLMSHEDRDRQHTRCPLNPALRTSDKHTSSLHLVSIWTKRVKYQNIQSEQKRCIQLLRQWHEKKKGVALEKENVR
jgi:hypothetical protein